MLKLFISRKEISICLFPTEISAVDPKNSSFLGKRVKNGGKQTNSKKKGTAYKRENFCPTYVFNLTGSPIEKKLWLLKPSGNKGVG